MDPQPVIDQASVTLENKVRALHSMGTEIPKPGHTAIPTAQKTEAS